MPEPQAGTAETKPQGSGNAGTGAGTEAGSGNAGTTTGATQGSGASGEGAVDYKAKFEQANDELLAQRPHIEEANRIRAAEAARLAQEAARKPPTGGADNGDFASQLTRGDVDTWRAWTKAEDPGLQALGRGLLAALELGNSGAIKATVARELLDVPREDRPLIEKRIKEGQAHSVPEAAQALKIERLQKAADEGKAAVAKLAELQAKPREPEPGTHIRSAPGGGQADGEPALMKVSELAGLYASRDPKKVAQARAFERRVDAKTAQLTDD